MPIVPVVGAFIDASPGSIYLFFRLAVLIPLVCSDSSFVGGCPPLSNFNFRIERSLGAFTQLPELLNKSLSPCLVLCLALEMKFALFVLVRSFTLSGVDLLN